uniref:Importin subunit alpha n=1 Tax=Parastrongyloides trichosuri TaxID=131310 RepID=A0A0N4ZMI5_PARTI
MASLSDRTNKEIEMRKHLYKNSGKCDEYKRKRAEDTVTLRKGKRDAMLMKRRNILIEEEDTNDGEIKLTQNLSLAENELLDIANELKDPNISEDRLYQIYRGIRVILSQNAQAPIEKLLSLGLLDTLVKALHCNNNKIIYEAAWAITNIASGTQEQTKAVVDAGVLPQLLKFLGNKKSSTELVEQCIWALANIVVDSQMYRDTTIKMGLLKILGDYIGRLQELPITLIRNIAWLFLNLSRHKNSKIPDELFSNCVKYLTTLLKFNDLITRNDALWSMSYLINGITDERLNKYFKSQIIMHEMLSFLGSNDNCLILGALRVIGSFARGNDSMCEFIISAGIFKQVIPYLLKSKAYDTEIHYYCIWILSNIMAGPEGHINTILSCNIMPLIFKSISSSLSKIKVECSWFLNNFVHGCSRHQIKEIIKCGGLPIICEELKYPNNDYIYNLLECIFEILEACSTCFPEKLEKIKFTIEECGALETLEELQYNQNEKIAKLCEKIIVDFFQQDDEFNMDCDCEEQFVPSSKIEI